ncbi:MAG: hypothetical protein ACUVXA_11940 [Candidatus Jordarchaeum sp.]|uniref:hypothetical protein n=1 Tax=Candidatus Jordarchaeum sp. TaxID=2823881 RepID=UPI00404A646A
MKKPVISVDELRKDLGLNKVWRLVFKDVIRRMLRPANVEGLLYFGICSNIVFLKEPLVKQFKKDLNKNDFIDILGKASELEIKPGVLRGICKVLIREGFLGETKISKHRVIKIAKDKNG